MSDVSGKRIVVTGGASGIGEGSARLLAERGAHVVISDLNSDTGESVVNALNAAGHSAYFFAADVSDANQVNDLVQFANQTLGGIDVMINNAGVDHKPKPMTEVPQSDFDRNMAVNVNGVWYCMRSVLPIMIAQGKGQIINVASVAGLRSTPLLSAYGASKHAVMGLTKAAAVEYAKANIRVNAICPSFVDTPMVQNTLKIINERAQQATIRANPMKRLGKVEEIAYAIAWLSSDESSFMTGQSVVLDGGMLA